MPLCEKNQFDCILNFLCDMYNYPNNMYFVEWKHVKKVTHDALRKVVVRPIPDQKMQIEMNVVIRDLLLLFTVTLYPINFEQT